MGLCGLLTPLVAFSAIAISIALSPWFSWARNALSDLGALNSPVWPIFNTGLVMAGLLASRFSYGILRGAEGGLEKAGSVLLLAGSVSLALIGLLPEDTGLPHFLVSVAFFFLTPLGFLILGLRDLRGPNRAYSALMVIFSLASLTTWASWACFRPPVGIAVPELIAALLSSASLVLLTSKALRGTGA